MLLPEMDLLLNSRSLVTSGLAKDPNFHFLMRASYEQIERVQTSSGSGMAFEESFVQQSS